MMEGPILINSVVEGPCDEAVARRLIRYVGADPGLTYGMRGKPHLLARIQGYNRAAYHQGFWFALVDLDAGCAKQKRSDWLPENGPRMCFLIAVHALESWLMADRESVAGFLSVPLSMVPMRPDELSDPKRTFVGLAARSRQRSVCDDMVPEPKSGRQTGRLYMSRICDFAEHHWRPETASESSESLRRCIAGLLSLVKHAQT